MIDMNIYSDNLRGVPPLSGKSHLVPLSNTYIPKGCQRERKVVSLLVHPEHKQRYSHNLIPNMEDDLLACFLCIAPVHLESDLSFAQGHSPFYVNYKCNP